MASGGGGATSGARVISPICKLCFEANSQQYSGGVEVDKMNDKMVSTLCLTQGDPPLKNPGYAPGNKYFIKQFSVYFYSYVVFCCHEGSQYMAPLVKIIHYIKKKPI